MIANTLMGDERGYFVSNVPGQVSLLASGTKAYSAGDVPEVPKAQGLTAPARSAYILVFVGGCSFMVFGNGCVIP